MRSWMKWLERGPFLFLVCALAWAGSARGQEFGAIARSGPKVLQAFEPVVSGPSKSTVRVRCEGKDVAFGTVVSTDGWIITKESVLTGKTILCKLRDGREVPARVVGVHEPYDLALLKVDFEGLAPITWRDSKTATVGKWVATVGDGKVPAAIGIVSVGTRLLKPGDQPAKFLADGGYLGVNLDQGPGGARLASVSKGAPADKAGLKADDVVTRVGPTLVTNTETLIEAIGRYKAGAVVDIRFKRGIEEMKLKATLGKRPLAMQGNPQDRMGSVLSNRRGGFPSILQHDTVLRPNDCGGPLVDLDGLALGVNIARAGRTESYAVPSEAVRALLPDLMSGKLAPRPDKGTTTPPAKK